MSNTAVTWTPDPARMAGSAIAVFISKLEPSLELPPAGQPGAFRALQAWSVQDPEAFWRAVWHDAAVIGEMGDGPVLQEGAHFAPPAMGGPRWFPNARLNFAENLLRHQGTQAALICWDERGAVGQWSHDELRQEVARVAAGFRTLGLQPGDRVAGWLPNIAETVIAMLAATSIGAVWTSCSPDFGVEGIVDRFGQTAPTLLIFADGYRYAGKDHDCIARIRELLTRLPSVRHAIRVKYLGDAAPIDAPQILEWGALGAAPRFLSTRCRSNGSPSTIRSTSCTRRAPQGCPSAWFTVPAVRCSSISRNIGFTVTCARVNGCSTSPRAAG
jgi:acetoacetyl-CoA synthetase